jgi:hypothetical protein
MRINTWLLLACLAGVWGCASVDRVNVPEPAAGSLSEADARRMWTKAIDLGSEQPRTLERMTRVSAMLEKAADRLTGEYDVQWQAAEAFGFVAEISTQSTVRIDAAKRGITFARRGQALLPDRVECHYWYALDVGLLADADRTYGIKGVEEMETALKRANELDERYDYAGPSRVLGILHLRTPPPPVSIGSPRKGLRNLQHAADLFPDYPENWLYLAEALRDNGQPEKVQELLRKVIDAPLWPDRQWESGRWKMEAQKLRQSLSGK